MSSRLMVHSSQDRKTTRLNSSHTVIYTLSLHDALPFCSDRERPPRALVLGFLLPMLSEPCIDVLSAHGPLVPRSEDHTSELQSHSDLHSFPTRRSSVLFWPGAATSGVSARVPPPHAFGAMHRCPLGSWSTRP